MSTEHENAATKEGGSVAGQSDTSKEQATTFSTDTTPAQGAAPLDTTATTTHQKPFWRQKKFFIIGAAAATLLLLGLVLFLVLRDNHVPVKQFTNVYSFVPEKISKSAAIPISVPDGVSEESARESITFSPEVEGEWQAEDEAGLIVFRPDEPLRSQVYYAVNMDTGSVQLSGDFFVDEDPQVEAILPAAGTEAHEDTEITIVFNRPMVPLTTLTTTEASLDDLPITIEPKTPGTFKWVSTRNLQFIPDTTLYPSSEYKVEIKEGLYSVEGLPIAPVTHEFKTRELRLENVTEGALGYRSPIILQFNQPVDLQKTARAIEVTKNGDDKVAIDVVYGETRYYSREEKKYITTEDKSKLFVYQAEDRHGRNRVWDFSTSYKLTANSAVPLYGNTGYRFEKQTLVSVPTPITEVDARSEQSDEVRPSLFDPAGKLTVSFYDDISIDKSSFKAKGLDSVVYAKRCKRDEEGRVVREGSECVEEDDLQKLIFDFNPQAFSRGESFALEIEKLETQDGFRINAEPLSIDMVTYPSPVIFSTSPGAGSGDAAIDVLYVCSNTPLKNPGEAGVGAYIKTQSYMVPGRWSSSYYIDDLRYAQHCKMGQFQTKINYGLLPETDYVLSIAATDEFGQTVTKDVSFKTGTPSGQHVRFLNLQQQYNVTPPNRTKFTYAVQNLEYVNMHICKLEPETFLARTVDRAGASEPPQSGGCSSVVSERIPLPIRYFVNYNFQIDIADYFADPRGHYEITFSHPLYKTTGKNPQPLYDRTYVSVTNLAVGKKEVQYTNEAYGRSDSDNSNKVLDRIAGSAQNLYWIVNNQTLAPIAGAEVTQYRYADETLTQGIKGYTDSVGIARAKTQANITGAVVRVGADTAVVSDWSDTLDQSSETRSASRTYVYTDRPIYRPGHTVHIRGIDRIGFDGVYEIWNEDEVELEIFDSQDASVYKVTVPQSAYGTFNASFKLPSNAPLGTYRIEVFGQSSWFDVEEYVPAAFKLEANTDKDEYINGDTLRLTTQADYYFGVPLSEGTVSYSVTAQDYYFDRYEDEYFNFGSSWYNCYSCGYGDDFLFRGEASIDENGRAVIEREMNLDTYFKDEEERGSKLVTVSLTAKDINGRSVSTQKSFIVHESNFYLGAKVSKYYTSVNTPITLRVKTVDTSGNPTSVSGITRTLYKVTWETFKRQEVDGGFYYRSEKRREAVSSKEFRTNDNGSFEEQLSVAEEGQYEVEVKKKDGRDHEVITTTNFYIYGARTVSVPPNNNYELTIETEKTNVEVGDTASILIKSPYERAKVLITVERGTVYDYWIADVTGGLYLHEFPIKSGYAPNINVSAVLLSPQPEVKYGSVQFDVGSAEHNLAVSVTPDKDTYLPGEKVTLSVQTKDSSGRPVPAEVSVAVADLSVLALKGNPKKDPIQFFYNWFPWSVETASNIKHILYEVDVPLGSKGGGGSPDDLAAKKRGLFKDTAYWSADVVTDAGGAATVSFTLPDNLTTWQIESVGITKDTKIGVDYEEFTTKKDLMAIPLKPRFVVPGDAFALGAKVFNQTKEDAKVEVQIVSDTLELVGEQKETVSIKAGEEKTVYFDVVAPSDKREGVHTFTFSANGGSLSDTVEQIIPITPNTTYETVATASFTKNDVVSEYLYIPKEVMSGEGGVTINANATLAVFMSDALTYMAQYPYGCGEQLASALSTIGSLKQALTVPNVEGEFETIEHGGVEYSADEVVRDGLARMYEVQGSGGGFSYYKGLEPNLELTLHVVQALSNVEAAGYEVRAGVLERAIAYIETEAAKEYSKTPNAVTSKELLIAAEYAIRQAGGKEDTRLTPTIRQFVLDKAFVNEQISSVALAYLAIITADDFPGGDAVYKALQNRMDIDGRGAYLKTGAQVGRDYFETPTKNTALLLKAFVAHGDENPATDDVLRWLLKSRDSQGIWGGTHNTFSVVDAMIDYLKWQDEANAAFSLKGMLDGVEIFGYEFNAKNVFDTFTHFIPMDDLVREKLLPLQLIKNETGAKESNLYYDIALKYFLPVENLPPRDEGITITRDLSLLDDSGEEGILREAAIGDIVRGKLTITIPGEYSHVTVEDMIPAGFEIVNFNLATEDQTLKDELAYQEAAAGEEEGSPLTRLLSVIGGAQVAQLFGAYSSETGGSYKNETRTLAPTHIESHDDRVFLYMEELQPGVYEYEYYLRALVPGTFKHLPARAEQMFLPEVFGRTSGEIVTVTK